MPLTPAELSYVDRKVANDSPVTGMAYLFWLVGGLVSAHRFYVGKRGTAVLQILSYFVLVGFGWLLIDLFLIPGMVRDRKNAVRSQVIEDLSTAERYRLR